MDQMPAPPLPPWLERQLPFDRTLVRAEGHWIHVMTAGQGVPVVMLHGNPTWGYLYRKVALALGGEPFRVIMPDLVGLGFSSKPARCDDHQLVHHARWIGAALDALGLERVVLVVQDWGGAIGLGAMAARPERLAGLVLLNTVVGPPRPGFKPTLFHRFSQTPVVSELVFRGLGWPQSMLHLAQGDRSSIGPEERRAYTYPLEGWRRRVAPLALARMVPDSTSHPSIPALRRAQEVVEAFDGPCAIVWGDRDPILGSVRRHLERLLPDARVTRTDGGHFIQEERPEEIAAAIRWVAGRL